MLDSTMGKNDDSPELRLKPVEQSAEFARENTPGFDETRREDADSGLDMKKHVDSMLDA